MTAPPVYELSHLGALEAEAVHIFREVAATFERPVLLFSGGKDSVVMLHVAAKAFWPAPLPFAVMHVDTGHNFDEVIEVRDRTAERLGLRMVVSSVQDDIDAGRVSEESGPRASRNRLQTTALLRGIRDHGFDAIFGGARRDEEKARAKERVFSVRGPGHSWDPKRQRPELWNLYNGQLAAGETLRVFPLSNWTELDVWTYIQYEGMDVVPLYFAAMRPTVERNGALIVVDDQRFRFLDGEKPVERLERFRSLGCYPLSAAVQSPAASIDDIVAEMYTTRESERAGRLIDNDQEASMEKKKREGYF